MTSGRRETSIRGSCVHSRYAENPRSVMLFFMNSTAQSFWCGSRIVILCGPHSCRRFGMRSHGLGLNEPSTLPVVIENLRVAPPVRGGIKLALHFLLGKMFIENIVKEFIVDRVIRLPLQNAVDLLQNSDVFQRRFAE